MYKERVEVVENVKISQSFYRLSLQSRSIAEAARPGQFLQIRVSDSFDPFLPRPMSICRVRHDIIDILYIILGFGTRMMALLKPGARIDVWGPLGSIFTPMPKKRLVYVAGGVGVAPLIFLATQQPVEFFLFGIRTREDMLPLSELSVDRSMLRLSSNDGTLGSKGYITEEFDQMIEQLNSKDFFIYTCGPTPMMQIVVKRAKEKGIPGEASLEEVMACGVGACLGCVTETKRGRLTVCRDGPVLPFEILPW